MIKGRMFLFFALFGIALLSSCSDDDEKTVVAPTAAGIFTDERDGQTYGWVRYGNTEWMTTNYKYDTGSSCAVYLNADEHQTATMNAENLASYGRLYTLQGALDACPEGWRLPTDEDWQNLEQQLGMSAGDAAKTDWRGNIAHNMLTIKGDTCALNLLLGGYFTSHTIASTPGFRLKSAYAFYWTSSQDTAKAGTYYYYRKLEYNRDEVFRESMEIEANKLSVRFVRDAQ